MSRSHQQSAAHVSVGEVRTSNHGDTSVRKSHQAPEAVTKPHQIDRNAAEILAASMFSNALDAANISRDEAAFLMGGITRSMVDQMCSTTVPKAPSLIQLLLLPPTFHLALIKELDKHYGLGRALLARVQESLGTLGLLVR